MATVLGVRDAAASACCGEGHGVGQRLTSTERAALTAAFGYRERVGSWSDDGAFRGLPDATEDRELRIDASWAVRVAPRAELSVTVPVLFTWREASGTASSGGGVGDVTATARYAIVPPEGDGSLPGFALTFAAITPFGRSAYRAGDPLDAEATGTGGFELAPGLVVEKTWWTGWFALVAASVGFHGPVREGPVEVRRAPRWQLFGAGGPSFDSGLSLAIGTRFDAEDAPEIDGVATGGWRRRLAMVGFAGYDLSDRLTVLASVETDLPFDAAGQNDLARIGGGLALKLAWSD